MNYYNQVYYFFINMLDLTTVTELVVNFVIKQITKVFKVFGIIKPIQGQTNDSYI